MYLVSVRLAGSRVGAAAEAGALTEAVWREAGEDDLLSHVYAQPGGPGLELVLFLRAERIEAAEQVAGELVRRGVVAEGLPFTVTHCAVDLLLPDFEGRL
ncbi:hypothetical protein CFP65_4689 [Kitasatospora sp. MMS16-BH015]|uniref:hypothetical protein n=1 Tax=Kitasatospora sp. MMS16-BH015 TaxID=2018025 RepID=UPI000CA14456|nr:hypothetical protein [Kitasatospora sp. MMS16-BH015]AUG79417.1 hypothetical protein CFP65_4689 [Kitasatospora sp. MMS16-BH015]